MTPPNDQNAPTGRLTAKRIAQLRGYVRERRQFWETARMAAEQMNAFDQPGALWNGDSSADDLQRRYREGSEARDRLLGMLNGETPEQRAAWVSKPDDDPHGVSSRFWDWFDRTPDWLVLLVLLGASGAMTLLAVVGALYLLGGVL